MALDPVSTDPYGPADTATAGAPSPAWPTMGRVNDLDPLASFAALLTEEGRALLDSLADYDPAKELATATRLRREHPAELVSAALGQARLRQRAVAKFGPEDARRMFFTPNGVEQATRRSVASYRAGRFGSSACAAWRTCAAESAATPSRSPAGASPYWRWTATR